MQRQDARVASRGSNGRGQAWRSPAKTPGPGMGDSDVWPDGRSPSDPEQENDGLSGGLELFELLPMSLEHSARARDLFVEVPQARSRFLQDTDLRGYFIFIGKCLVALDLTPQLEQVGEHQLTPFQGHTLLRDFRLNRGRLGHVRYGVPGGFVRHTHPLFLHGTEIDDRIRSAAIRADVPMRSSMRII